MQKRSSKGKRDINQTAFAVVQQATQTELAKNPAAVALGRLGGLKGGKARKESLSAKRRVEIAKKAAVTRWKRQLP